MGGGHTTVGVVRFMAGFQTSHFHCLFAFKSSTKLIRQLVFSQFVSLSLLFTHAVHNSDEIVDRL